MFRRFFLLIVIFSGACSCVSSYQYEEPVYGKMADKISVRTIKILSKRHDMYLVGTGGGFIDHVNLLSLSFDVCRPLALEDARELIIDSVEEFLFQINSNEEIRPYLKNYPFTSADVKVSIFSYSQKHESIYDPYISAVSNVTRRNSNQTELWFRTEAPDQPFGYKTEIREDYEEALRIVKGKTEEK